MAFKQKPDVILLDLLMPGLSGQEVLAQIRKMPEIQHIPVIILTAHTGDVPKEIEEEIVGFLRKPFKSQSILDAFKRIFPTI